MTSCNPLKLNMSFYNHSSSQQLAFTLKIKNQLEPGQSGDFVLKQSVTVGARVRSSLFLNVEILSFVLRD